MIAYIQAAWDDSPDTKIYIAAVHGLSEIGAVVTHVAHGISQDGFDAEWRDVHVLAVEGDIFSRCELFNEADLDTAIARFEQLSRPATRLENAASRANERSHDYFAARDWDAIAEIIADDISTDDRRRVVNAGLLQGRDASIESFRWAADLGVTHATSALIATRGERLVLARARYSHSDDQPQPFDVDLLNIVEINADGRIGAVVIFDLEDIDAAIAELDARYLAGEAVAHARTWTLIADNYAAFNQGELPLTAKDFVNVDHRKVAAFAPGDLLQYLRAGWEVNQTIKSHIEVVHRLNDLGAVVTHAADLTSREGFDAEWRSVDLLTTDGDLVHRCELFDESDLDAALARFDQLSQPAAQLENAASRVDKRFQACFAAQDWDVMAKMLSDGFSIEDRRRVVNLGNLHGRDAELGVHAYATVGTQNVKSTVIATRAQRLSLKHYRFSGRDQRPDAFRVEMLAVVEIDAEERMAAVVVFDVDDIEAAIAELDARYFAGEAAPHARTWSAISTAYAAMNRHEFPPTTPNWENLDHRRARAFAPGDAAAYVHATWDILAPHLYMYIEVVHRLSNVGVVVTRVTRGTSQEGFDAEWREICVSTAEGDLINHSEIFDEQDIDAALARFDELNLPARRLENAATRMYERLQAYYATRNWAAITEIVSDDLYSHDRRPVVGGGIRHGRDALIEDLRAVADVGVTNATSDAVATRGERLAVTHARFSRSHEQPEAFHVDFLQLVVIDADERITAVAAFDVDDINAALEELDARYLAGEAAPYARTWSVITGSYAAINRHEQPALTQDWINVDHRRETAMGPGDLIAYIHAASDRDQDNNSYPESVHRLNNLGAVITYAARETSQEGFNAEWRGLAVFTLEGDLINRCEVFDEADLDAAVARFEELQPQARRLENASSRMAALFLAQFAAGNWDSMAEMLIDDYFSDDRRRVVGAGLRHGRDAQMADMRAIADLWITNVTSTVIATRGERLALTRSGYSGRHQGSEAFRTDAVAVGEINADGRIAAAVVFDPDDIDAAFTELDARYLAGEAAAYAHAWSVVAEAYAAFNRHELPATDWVTIDRRGATRSSPAP